MTGVLQLGPFDDLALLQPGARLQFTVVGRQGDRSASAVQVVSIVAGQPPQVQLSSSSEVTATGEVRVAASAVSASCTMLYAPGTEPASGQCTATFAYSVADTVGGAALPDGAVLSKPDRPVLVLGGGYLTPGSSYAITLRVTDAATGGEGMATAAVYVTRPPVAGSLVVTKGYSQLNQCIASRALLCNLHCKKTRLVTWLVTNLMLVSVIRGLLQGW